MCVSADDNAQTDLAQRKGRQKQITAMHCSMQRHPMLHHPLWRLLRRMPSVKNAQALSSVSQQTTTDDQPYTQYCAERTKQDDVMRCLHAAPSPEPQTVASRAFDASENVQVQPCVSQQTTTHELTWHNARAVKTNNCSMQQRYPTLHRICCGSCPQ